MPRLQEGSTIAKDVVFNLGENLTSRWIQCILHELRLIHAVLNFCGTTPEGVVSRESIRPVKKLDHLKDIVSRHVESSRSSFTDLLHGLFTYDPTELLTARQALDHPFFRNPT